MTDTDDLPEDLPAVDRSDESSWRLQSRIAIGLLVGGVLAMVVPGLLRDGICGLLACADVTPEVAVGRPASTALAVVIPENAADELQSIRLFEIEEGSTGGTEQAWVLYRSDDSTAEVPDTIDLGAQPDGFVTDIELTSQVESGLWVLEASFGCSSTLVRFSPVELDPGYVSSGGIPETVTEFRDDAQSSVRCSAEAPLWQRFLFIIGGLAASVGAIMGMVVMFRRPPKDDDPEWFGP